MKSKTLNLPGKATEKEKTIKTYDFLKYYNTADGNCVNIKESSIKNDPETVAKPSKRRQNSIKMAKTSKGKTVNMTKIDIDGTNLNSESGKRSPLNESKATSTPNVSNNKNSCIKSIMKGTSDNESQDISNVPRIKPKKRNKSVSFMLEDNEEVVIKKTKSNDSLVAKSQVTDKNKLKRDKVKSKLVVKEDKENNNIKANDAHNKNEINKNKRKSGKKIKNIPDQEMGDGDNKNNLDDDDDVDNTINEKANETKKKKRKRGKKGKLSTTIDSDKEGTDETVEVAKQKPKRTQKNKHTAEASESEEPAKKTKKKNKPDVIAKGIENLNIGDNAHTLTNLLDEMTVNKNKKKRNRNKPTSVATEVKAEESTNEVKKSKKRKNKKKNRNLNAVVLVQNLPFSIILNYRQLLKEHFSKFGNVQSIGIADLKCEGEDPKPIFTTRIFFATEEAALAAVTEDKTSFENNIIRVKKYIAPAVRPVKRGSWVNSSMRSKKPAENDETNPETEKMAPEVDSGSD
ncbi:suppressor of Mek1-like [Zerene cesonia]|uniref:suppressor of Mek1-like n=1 Tax=Zerene cesonia TaxID=33412 RepID=UPI0018E4F1A0|nr:suppressor of Mek1-like [Zerene cesonia]